MTLKLEHCQPFAAAVASSGENIRSSGEPGKGEGGRLVEAMQHSVRAVQYAVSVSYTHLTLPTIA